MILTSWPEFVHPPGIVAKWKIVLGPETTTKKKLGGFFFPFKKNGKKQNSVATGHENWRLMPFVVLVKRLRSLFDIKANRDKGANRVERNTLVP